MKISLEWLREIVDVPWEAGELAHRLTMGGLEVEAVESETEKFPKVVIGEVVERVKHPNADSLSACKVNVGTEVLEIVCGAPNVDAGQKVAVALVGAPIGDFVIAKRKIRGMVSNGMICSAKELGLGDDHSGIMVLAADAKIGTPFREYLGMTDTVLEIGITPNRADALSHIGVARDIAALAGTAVHKPEVKIIESKAQKAEKLASVEVKNAEGCPRYSARVLRGVKIGKSPEWLQRRLQRVGIRPINNIVDVTNYVLMECGHPLHAFDYDKLEGHKIVVRNAAESETFVTLDGKSRTLCADTLLICDGARGVAIAGVMGGQNSEISDTTTNVLIESAYFDPSAIRRTSKFLGLSTDSSYRFERGTDIENTIYAVNRAAQMMHELAGGEIAEGIIDVYPKKREPKQVTVRAARVNVVLGVELGIEEMIAVCAKLEFAPAKKSDAEFSVMIPSYRPDMEGEIDVIEEIARIIGYDRFAPKTPYINMHLPLRSSPAPADVREKIRNTLTARGYTEVVTSSLLDEQAAGLFSDKLVKLANPLSAEMAVVRPHPLPQVLATIARNIHLGTRDIRIFEISRSYERAGNNSTMVDKRFAEKEWLTIALCGATPAAWDSKPRPSDFYDVKGEVEQILKTAALDKFKFIPYNAVRNVVYGPASLAVVHSGREIGSLGAVSPDLLKGYDIESGVCIAMIEIGAMQSVGKRPQYAPPLRFPGIVRDLAIVAPAEKSAQEIEDAISKSASSPLLRSVKIFDVFEGGAVGEDKKSLAFSLEFAADDRTLRDEEAAEVMGKIIKDLEQRHHFIIRS